MKRQSNWKVTFDTQLKAVLAQALDLQIFTDWELTGVILFLVLVDILVMSLWIGVDTPEIITTTLESQVSKATPIL